MAIQQPQVPETGVEPIIDTSKLHFKKKSLTTAPTTTTTTVTGSAELPSLQPKAASRASGPLTVKTPLTKSHSQNESLTVPQRNLVNINPAANCTSSTINSSGGISNMSFDDY
jgi:hypothetical protein